MASREEIMAATRKVVAMYPFPGYIDLTNGSEEIYVNVASTVTKHVPAPARILDFGSGSADKTAVLSMLGYDCSAFDDLNDYWHREGDNLDKILGFTEAAGVDLRLAEKAALTDFEPGFDLVMSHDVFEHLHDSPRQILNALIGLLAPGGVLFLSVPNAANLRKRIAVVRGETNHAPFRDYFWHPGDDWRGHIREYVKSDMEFLADYCNLEVLEIRGCDHMLNSLPGGPKARTIWSKVTTGPLDGLKDSLQLVARKPVDWAPIEIPAETRELFTRLGGSSAL